MCPGPPVGAWAFPLGRSLRRLRWQAVAHRQSRCPRSISPNHSPGTAPGRIRGYQARKGLPPAAAKGAPVRAPFGGPRPSRPLRPAGRYPCPPWAAAWRRPPRLLSQSGKCGGQGRAPAGPGPVKLAASRCAGAPLRNARPSPCGAGRWPGLALLLPRAGCGVGAPGRPGPHSVGAVGPCAPPARSAALRPPPWLRPRLRRALAMGGLPAHSPPGVAAAAPRGDSRRLAGAAGFGALVCGPCPGPCPSRAPRPCGAAIWTAARIGGASAAVPALRARRGAGKRRLRAGRPRLRTPVKGEMYRATRGP